MRAQREDEKSIRLRILTTDAQKFHKVRILAGFTGLIGFKKIYGPGRRLAKGQQAGQQ